VEARRRLGVIRPGPKPNDRSVAPLDGVTRRATPGGRIPNHAGRAGPRRSIARHPGIDRTRFAVDPGNACDNPYQLFWIASMTIAAATMGSFGTLLASSMTIS